MQHKRLVIDANICWHQEMLKAKARIASRDVNDWPAVAGRHYLLDCPVWTEDKDFLGAGVAIWTTATVEIYLSDA